jgi:hypothetical protein
MALANLVAGPNDHAAVSSYLCQLASGHPGSDQIPQWRPVSDRWQLAGIAKKQLGTQVADLSAQRNEIIAAIDLLIIGF